MASGPTYPVLALAHDGSIIAYDGDVAIASCNAIAFWRNHYYEDLQVFDAAAHAWRVVDVSVVDPPGSVARTFARIANGRLRVALKWKRESDRDGIDHARAETEAWLHRDEEFWESSADIDEWVRRVRACDTMEKLVSMFR